MLWWERGGVHTAPGDPLPHPQELGGQKQKTLRSPVLPSCRRGVTGAESAWVPDAWPAALAPTQAAGRWRTLPVRHPYRAAGQAGRPRHSQGCGNENAGPCSK